MCLNNLQIIPNNRVPIKPRFGLCICTQHEISLCILSTYYVQLVPSYNSEASLSSITEPAHFGLPSFFQNSARKEGHRAQSSNCLDFQEVQGDSLPSEL